MTLSTRERLRAYAGRQQVIALAGDRPARELIAKSGLLPFRQGDSLEYYVMRPKPKQSRLGPPPLQICKGTRMINVNGSWVDMRKDMLPAKGESETLLETALREAEEEIGLDLPSVVRLFDLGVSPFVSASTGKTKRLWLFAAQMRGDAIWHDSPHATAAVQRSWCSLEEFGAAGRADHLPILEAADKKLMAWLEEK